MKSTGQGVDAYLHKRDSYFLRHCLLLVHSTALTVSAVQHWKPQNGDTTRCEPLVVDKLDIRASIRTLFGLDLNFIQSLKTLAKVADIGRMCSFLVSYKYCQYTQL